MADAQGSMDQIEYRWHHLRDLSPFASSMSPESVRGWDSWIRNWVRHPYLDGLSESVCYQVQPNGRAALAWRYRDSRAAGREDGTWGRPLVARVLVGPTSLLTPEVAIVLCRAGLPTSAGPGPGQVREGDELPRVPVGGLRTLVFERAAGLDEEAARQDGLPQVVAAALSAPETPLAILILLNRILKPPGEGVQCPLLWGLRRVLWPLVGRTGRGWSFSTFEPPMGASDPAALPDIVFRQLPEAPPPGRVRREVKIRPFDPSALDPASRYAQLAEWLVAEYRMVGGDELRRLIDGWCGAEQAMLLRLDKVYDQLCGRWSPAADASAPTQSLPSRSGHAFISYVREDSLHVDSLQRRLEKAGVRVWRDTADLWPGEDWRREIRQAIQEDALVFIACFSQRSIARKTSFQNEELTWAIEQLRRRRPDDPWLIPVRFSDCDIPDLDIGAGRTLGSIQRADLFGERSHEGIARLVAAVLRILGPDGSLARSQDPRDRPATASAVALALKGPDFSAESEAVTVRMTVPEESASTAGAAPNAAKLAGTWAKPPTAPGSDQAASEPVAPPATESIASADVSPASPAPIQVPAEVPRRECRESEGWAAERRDTERRRQAERWPVAWVVANRVVSWLVLITMVMLGIGVVFNWDSEWWLLMLVPGASCAALAAGVVSDGFSLSIWFAAVLFVSQCATESLLILLPTHTLGPGDSVFAVMTVLISVGIAAASFSAKENSEGIA